MTRLSKQQLQALKEKAAEFQKRLVQVAKKKVPDGTNQGAFFATLFQMAAECIEDDVEGFCDLAETIFEEIEAHGQEPQLSEDWLAEITGEKDNFYFSTDNLVSDLVTKPRRKRRKKQLSDDEIEQIKHDIEAAIIDDDSPRDLHQALAVAHGENVEEWIRTINQALEKSDSRSLDFWMLQKMTGLESAELLLGLLLGQEHWMIEQRDFYDEVLIKRKKKGEGSIHP